MGAIDYEVQIEILKLSQSHLLSDALDLDSSMPISMATPQRRNNANGATNMSNFAKSLPIEIANSPLTKGRSYLALDSEDDVSSRIHISI